MRIKEILDEALVQPTYTQDEPLPTEYDLDDLYRERGVRDMNSGWYSYGKAAKDPHEYNVQTHLPSRLDLDAKYIWIKAITPLMGDNPYIPVYYNVKLKPDKLGNTRLFYTMERLYDLDQLQRLYNNSSNEDEKSVKEYIINLLYAMLTRIFGTRYVSELKRVWPSTTPARTIWEWFIDSLRKPIEYKIQDKDLLDALAIINDLQKNHGLTPDIHPGNVMLRNTSRGIIPVITDPLSDDGRSIIGRKY